MDAATQYIALVAGSLGLATLETIGIFLARRDFKLGLKKWFLKRLGRRPIKIRLYGPDGTVKEHVIGTKGKETIKIEDGVFMIRSKAIRKCDDDINELSYSYKNVLPFTPEAPVEPTEGTVLSPQQEEVLRKLRENIPLSKDELKIIDELKARNDQKKAWIKIKLGRPKPEEASADPDKQYEPVDQDDAPQGTNPNLLDKFVEYVYLVAKAEALKKLGNIDFWIKAGAIAAVIAALAGIAAWYGQGKDLLPAIQMVGEQCVATAKLAAGNATIVTGGGVITI